MRSLLLLLPLLLLLLLLSPARAQEAQDEPVAWQHFQKGSHLFGNKHFLQAAQEFQRAFLVAPQCTWLIYDIGQSYEHLAAGEPDPTMAMLALRRAFVAYRDHYLALAQRLRLEAQELTRNGRSLGPWQMSEKPDGLERGDGVLQAALPWPTAPPDVASGSPPDATSGAMPSATPNATANATPNATEDPQVPGPLAEPRAPAVTPSVETLLQALPAGELGRALERHEQKMRAEEEWLQRRARWRRTRRVVGLATLLPGVGMSVLGANLFGRLPAFREQLAGVPQGANTSELLPLLQRIERHSIASSVLLPAGLALVSVGVAVLIPSW